MFVAALLMASNSQAQSLKGLFSKENIEKVVNSVTGKSAASMEGAQVYTGSAIELESDNLLQKVNGSVAANVAGNKLNGRLVKMGITTGQMSLTFNADSTFTVKTGARSLKGTYSYDTPEQKANSRFIKLTPLNTKMSCISANMDSLLSSDKLLKLITLISNRSNNTILKTIGSLTGNYGGMMLGFSLKKE